MTTIKSYTDLEQSKKLAEILLLESADMYYHYNTSVVKNYHEDIPNVIQLNNHFAFFNDDIPCWSLAALLGVLPTYLFEFDRGIDLNIYPHLNGKSWHCSYMPNCIENMKTDKFRLITSEDNPIDACYEMILKLNELKML